jgi:hypothetical protein
MASRCLDEVATPFGIAACIRPNNAFLNMINCDGLKATLIRCLMELFWVSKQN